MKRLFSLGAMILFVISLQAQDSIVNHREHGEQYFLSEPFQDSCMSLDLYEYDSISQQIKVIDNEDYGYWDIANLIDGITKIADIAQPFYSDTTLKIIGVSIYSTRRYYLGRNGFLCIADSNMNILKRTPIYDVPISVTVKQDLNKCWYQYEEFFFDTAINIQGKFYAVLDNPKPDSIYNWQNIVTPNDDAYRQYFMKAWVMAAMSNTNPYTPSTECPVSMLPLIKKYGVVDTTVTDPISLYGTAFTSPNASLWNGSDTAWHEVNLEKYTNSWRHKFVYAYYIFPILASNNDSIQDTSALSSVTVDNFTFIFPNPTSDNVTVQCSFRMKNIEVYNSLGQKVEEFSVDGYNKSINTEKYPKGNYILKIITESGTSDKKLVVQ